MERLRVYVAEKSYPDYTEEKRIVNLAGGELQLAECRTEDDIIEQCHDAHAILLRQTPIGEKALKRLGKLKVVSRYGTGCDNVDIAASTRHGVMVTVVPDYCVGEVADHTIALLLSAIRKIPLRDRLVRLGKWDIGSQYSVSRTMKKSMGFVGYGKTAREVRHRLSGFPFRFFAADPDIKREIFEKDDTTPISFRKLAIISDYISIHAPLTDETYHLFNLATFRMMKKDAILINTSRGGVVDQRALYTALQEGFIGGAALDVFEKEPFDPKSPLADLESVILSDHASWYSEESRRELQRRTAEAAVQALNGGTPKNLVNPEVLISRIITLQKREETNLKKEKVLLKAE
ncbi:MAG: C-terminal binding protein [Spirochaetota bacterium]|nr:MAG: C-terminal binding protein [Spirochaetota bacterium]